MAKRAIKLKRVKEKKPGLLKILELVVVLGGVAAVLVRFFKGRKTRK